MQDYVDVIKSQTDQLMKRVPGLAIEVEWEFRSKGTAGGPTLFFRYAIDYKGQHRAGEHDLIDLGPRLADALEQSLGSLATEQADILNQLRCPQ
ncbi:MAG: hypothetical protein ACJ8FY_28805 [Gemmataceae bacterium]